ncbi:MAG: hypothetical protein JXR10_06820 [Cyclobacteriaceae bacterium]
MGNVFVISDLHFGHRNMAIRRGFESVEDHDSHIITSWNEVVRKGDVVWILGDLTMEKASNYNLLDKLRGYKKVVLGNHDRPNHIPRLLNHVNSVCGMYQYKDVIFTHCPIHVSQLSRFRANFHGHVHLESLDDNRYINISAEVIDFKPQKVSDYLQF